MAKENKIPKTKMPERLMLDKKEISLILNSITDYWDRSEMNAIENAGYSSIMAMVKACVHTQSLTTLKNIWFSVQEATRQMETLNGIKLSLGDAQEDQQSPHTIEQFQQLYNKQLEKIQNGEAFEN